MHLQDPSQRMRAVPRTSLEQMIRAVGTSIHWIVVRNTVTDTTYVATGKRWNSWSSRKSG